MTIESPLTETRDSTDAEREMSVLGALIERSQIYRTGPDYMGLLNFISRMRHMAPFNAALLHVQKPGIRFAATDVDWWERYRREVKEGARPLLILWPFGPVALVYDVEDTEGPDLPPDVAAPFRAQGDITECQIQEMFHRLYRLRISCEEISYGSGKAGHVKLIEDPSVPMKGGAKRSYAIRVNASHDPNVQFATLAHELGHLFLGHLGYDAHLDINTRRGFDLAQTELEAEMVSYLVCERQGVLNVSEPYLAPFLRSTDTVERLDINAITRAAHRVETALGLSARLNIGVDRHGHQIASSGPPPASKAGNSSEHMPSSGFGQ